MSWIRGRATEARGSGSLETEGPPKAEPEARLAPRPAPLELPVGVVRRNLATLDPGYFAWVMGSGIVSVGAELLRSFLLSRVTFDVTLVAYVILVVAYVARAVLFWPYFRRSLLEPTTAMGYFTVVAGTNVLAIRFAMSGYPLVTLGLGAAGALVWLVLTYGLPWSIVAAAHRPVLRELNGTWLIWVVATQSLPSWPPSWPRQRPRQAFERRCQTWRRCCGAWG